MAAIHQGVPGRATRSLPWLFLNQSLLLFLLFYSSLFSNSGTFFLWVLSLHFHSSSGSISLSGWKTTEDLPVLEAIRLHLMCLPPSPSLVGVKRRTACYIWVNRQRWRDASPRALSAERPRLLKQNLDNEWLVTTWKWYRCGYWLASCGAGCKWCYCLMSATAASCY